MQIFFKKTFCGVEFVIIVFYIITRKGGFMWNSRESILKVQGDEIMKKIAFLVAALLVAVVFTGCGSLRTPSSGARSKYVYYNTFFGLSLESAVYGDGLVVSQK